MLLSDYILPFTEVHGCSWYSGAAKVLAGKSGLPETELLQTLRYGTMQSGTKYSTVLVRTAQYEYSTALVLVQQSAVLVLRSAVRLRSTVQFE